MSQRDLPKSPLAAFLRAHSAGILDAWERAERRRAPGERPPGFVALREELPSVFERIAERLDAAVSAAVVPQSDEERDSWTGVESVSAEFPEPLLGFRVLDRLRDGFDLEDVTAQYAVLRRCVLRFLERTGTQPSWLEMTVLHEALDQVIIDPAARSAAARERALGALDRVSAEGVGSAQIDRLLRRLLEVLLESARSADWAVMLLLEGESLRIRAGIGIDEALWSLRAYRLAEGFIGRVVRERRPVALRSAAPDPLATDAGGGAAGSESGAQSERPSDALHALYGVPLLAEGRLLGVAVMSSRRVAEFSEGDRLLFRKAAERAAALATQAQLREQLAAERSRLEATIQRLPVGVAIAEGASGALVLGNRRFSEIVRGPDETPSNAPLRTLLSETDDDQRARWLLFRALHGGETVSGEELEFVRGDGERRRGSFTATPVRDADGRITAAVMVVDDVTERRKAERARELLVEASALLASSPDHEGTIEHVVRLGGERFADLCALDLLDDGGGAPRLVAAARVSEARAILPRLSRLPPLLLADGGASAEVMARGEATLVPLVTDPWLQRIARGPEHLAALRELGARSAILVPLAARGRKLGLLSVWTIERELHHDDAAVAAELGRLASLVLENARLHREAARPR
ncbi:GAF domain-containing protein [Sorangium sp. So ce131]|uniref:GAF domain-containing protein n=1 Tax=Sorangium sp. So ce131 TaxID=3133282 RepID=UPI003F5E794B